jgi:murein DD-endopeptidase MepM/ murein hydrolase activator NlpD
MKKFLAATTLFLLAAGCNNSPAPVSSGQDFVAPGQQSQQAPGQSSNPAAPVSISKQEIPLSRAAERITKKMFGTKVSPQNSPVQPEKFSGYHTGVDFETFPEEKGVAVPVYAICDGKVLQSRTATGYGGVMVQSCTLDNQAVTVVYGHINLSSALKAGAAVKKGDQLAILGEQGPQTDGERKHLHLGIHKGTAVNIKGYVQTQAELSSWIDYQKIAGL